MPWNPGVWMREGLAEGPEVLDSKLWNEKSPGCRRPTCGPDAGRGVSLDSWAAEKLRSLPLIPQVGW